VYESYARGSGLPEDGTPWGPPVLPSTTPGEARDARESYQQTQSGVVRQILENAPSLLPFSWAPRAVTAGTKWLPWLAQKAVPLAKRGATMFGVQDLAVRAANAGDPWNYTNPEISALLNAGGEVLGGVAEDALRAGGRLIRPPWQETPGTVAMPGGVEHRQVLERLDAPMAPGMVSDDFFPKIVDVGLQHTPLGGRARGVYKAAQKKLDAELLRHKAQHPGGTVTAQTDQVSADVLQHQSQQAISQTPEAIRTRWEDVIATAEKKHDQIYSDLTADYRSRPIPWHFGKKRVPYLTKVEDLLLDPSLAARQGGIGENSIFGETVRLMQALDGLPDTMTLDGALDMQRAVGEQIASVNAHLADVAADPSHGSLLTESIRKKVLPALGQAKQQLDEFVRPYLIDLSAPKDKARQVIHAWETRGTKVPQTMLEGADAGKVGYLEDPQVMAARTLLEKPDFVLFDEAHALRSDFGKIARAPGQNIGNTAGKQAEELKNSIDGAMKVTADRMSPEMTAHWRRVDGIYKEDAQVLNSPLLKEFAGKNLDDIMTTMIQAKRPGDMKTLRQVFGDQTMNDAGQMWLTQRIREATDPTTGKLTSMQDLLETLNTVTKETEQAVFPGGLMGIRNRLRQGIDLEAAVKEVAKGADADPRVLATLKTRVNDPAMWAAVQSDVLAPMLTSGTDPIKGATLLDGLNKLPDAVRHALFDPAHYKELMHLAHTSRAVEQVANRSHLSWSPLVRRIEHGLILTGLGYWTGDPLAPMAYFIGTAGMAKLLTNPKTVQLLTRGMTTAPTQYSYGEIVGKILGQAHAMGLAGEEAPVPMRPNAPAPSAPAGAPVAAH